MMITLTPEDFRKLSEPCQRELLVLLLPEGSVPAVLKSSRTLATDASIAEEAWQDGLNESDPETVSSPKQVVDLSIEEARLLIARLSERNLEHLKRFAKGEWVALNDMYGPKPLYEDELELKRSFIGAVNRRLRSVTTKHEKAKLFSLNRHNENQIRVTPQTATALRVAMDLPEPLDICSYRNLAGEYVNREDSRAVALRSKLDEAWSEFEGRPGKFRTHIDRVAVARYLVSRGIEARLGTDLLDDDEANNEFILSGEDFTAWQQRIQENGDIYVLKDGEAVWPGEVFLGHPDLPGVLAELSSVHSR